MKSDRGYSLFKGQWWQPSLQRMQPADSKWAQCPVMVQQSCSVQTTGMPDFFRKLKNNFILR